MSTYLSNLRDQQFCLEVFGYGVFGMGPHSDMSVADAVGALREFDRLARGPIGASYVECDRHPPAFDAATRTVNIPPAFQASLDTYLDSGFAHAELPEELGGEGVGIPRMLHWALGELLYGCNPAVGMAACGASFARVLYELGTEQQQKWARYMIDNRWYAAMVLTEPTAGSDVGAGRAKARRQPDGSYHIEADKRFITNGDMDGQVVYFTLARVVGEEGVGGPGTKGLSLFVVFKYNIDEETCALGERNGVFVTGMEKKMGLAASPTCSLAYGKDGVPAKGYLVGGVHDGIAQMFRIIEGARMMVGTKAMAGLSNGYLHALAFARERVQGPDMTRMTDRTAPKVTIIHHPDVRRSLLRQKAYAEGLRALTMLAAYWQDRVIIEEAAGNGKLARQARRMNKLLLPIVKAVCSERACELLSAESLQTFGGSGFVKDSLIEQLVRDAKIDTLYEGTTAIQALDLILRSVVRAPKAAQAMMAEIQAFIDREAGGPELKDIRAALAKSLAAIGDVFTTGTTWLAASKFGQPEEIYKVGLSSRDVILAAGDVLIGWLLARKAEVASAALAEGGLSLADEAFYLGKVEVARFFADKVLALIPAQVAVITSTSLQPMRLPEAAF